MDSLERKVLELYIGYYNRAADPEGFQFWLDRLRSGRSVGQIAREFANLAEPQQIYPVLVNPATATVSQIATFINSVFQNIFGRNVEPEGLQFYIYLFQELRLNSRQGEVGTIVQRILDGAQNSDRILLNNKTLIAQSYKDAILRSSTANYDPIFGRNQIFEGLEPLGSVSVTEALQRASNAVLERAERILHPIDNPFKIDFIFDSNFSESQRQIIQNSAGNWERLITQDSPDFILSDGTIIDDLRVVISMVDIDGSGKVLARGGFRNLQIDAVTGRPLKLPSQGQITFDRADLQQMESSGSLDDLTTHELGHVLGIGTLWERQGLTSTDGSQYIGAAALQIYNQGLSTSAIGIPIDMSRRHWNEQALTNELMTPALDVSFNSNQTLINPLTQLTAASLIDLGYSVDLSLAGPMSSALI